MSEPSPHATGSVFRRLRTAALAVAGVLAGVGAGVGAGLGGGAPALADSHAADHQVYGDTLIWRLTPPDGGPASHIVGTMHVPDERLEPILQRALAQLDGADMLIVEADVTGEAQMAIAAQMMMTDGSQLADLIGQQLYDRLVEIGAAYGMPSFFLRTLKPWGAAMLISVPPEQMTRMAAGEEVFDQRLISAAQAQGTPVLYLEDIQEQIDAFSDYSLDQQVAMLDFAIRLYPQLDGMFARMMELYVSDDLAGLAYFALEEMTVDDPALSDAISENLIYQRNANMAERIAEMSAGQAALVGIGALHLPGERGVLNLLAAEGWTVEPAE